MHGEPVDRCFLLEENDDQVEHPKDVDTFIKQVFGDDEVKEVKEIFEIDHEEDAIEEEKAETVDADKSNEDVAEKDKVVDKIDEEISEWEDKQYRKEWSIIYNKHQDWVIDRDEYDKIIINLLQSYQEFKQVLLSIDELKEIEEKFVN